MFNTRQRPPLAARLVVIRQRADDRAYRLARRYRGCTSEFPDVRAFVERHAAYAKRAWLLQLTEIARGSSYSVQL